MKLIKKYRKKFIHFIFLFLVLMAIYYLAKTATGFKTSLILGMFLLVGIVYVFIRFKDILISLRNNYGELALKLAREYIQRINSIFIGFYGLGFLLSVNVSDNLNYFPFNEFSFMTIVLVRALLEFVLGFVFLILARLSFDRQKKFLNILYPLLAFTGFYLILIGDTVFSLVPLFLIGFISYLTREALIKDAFVFSVEEIIIDSIFAGFWAFIYLKNIATDKPLENYPSLYKILFFAIFIGVMLLCLKLILIYMKKDVLISDEPDIGEFRDFVQKNTPTSSTTAGLGFLKDKYIYYYTDENGEKLVAFLYQIVNNKIIVMGEPFGDRAYLDEALSDFIDKSYIKSLNPVFYEVGEKFTLNLHDYGFDFMKFGENALIDLGEFSLAGRKKSSLRNILNRFEKDGYKFEILDPPYDDKLLDRLEIISDKWLKGREEKGFSLGFFDRDYLNESRLGLVYDKEGDVTAFTNIMPNYDPDVMTIDLMRYDTEMNVNSMMDYLFLNLFLKAQEEGMKYFNLGMAPLANVGKYKSAYLSERVAAFIYGHADSIYPFKGLRNYKSKYASLWEPRYTCFGKGNLILSSLLAVFLADKKHNKDV
ncbi:phosphatidylglycerol lysyltransferase domain-containing protein [uncultured Anaerococcus sp.]|uniref:phosphatidylglycerol lysyltransferase domain-containing protein n=1 Tax=uncultured Anaerococcus sp. TaxID=293428 RepID=UPI0025DDBE04|nr:phosphatidylglycerol lysyltransferase domain-containing protein [uncultured Anaerococcus sp.]